jgi:hypothetical protein
VPAVPAARRRKTRRVIGVSIDFDMVERPFRSVA